MARTDRDDEDGGDAVTSLTSNILGSAGWDSARRVARSLDCGGPRAVVGAATHLRDALNAGKVQVTSSNDIIALTRDQRRPWWRYVDPRLSGKSRTGRIVIALWECDDHQLLVRKETHRWAVVTTDGSTDLDDFDDDGERMLDPNVADVFEIARQQDAEERRDPEPAIRRRKAKKPAAPRETVSVTEEQSSDTDTVDRLAFERQARITLSNEVQELRRRLMIAETSLEKTQRVNEELARQRRDLEATVERLTTAAHAVKDEEAASTQDAQVAIIALQEQLATEIDTNVALRSQVAALERSTEHATALAGDFASLSAAMAAAERAAAEAAHQHRRETSAMRTELDQLAATVTDRDHTIVELSLEAAELNAAHAEMQRVADETAAMLRVRESHIIALSSGMTDRDNDARVLRRRLDHAAERERATLEQLIAARHAHEQVLSERSLYLERIKALQSELAQTREDVALAEDAGRLMDRALERALSKRHLERVRKELRSGSP